MATHSSILAWRIPMDRERSLAGCSPRLPLPGNNQRHHFVVRKPSFWEHQASLNSSFTVVTQQETGVFHHTDLGHFSTV